MYDGNIGICVIKLSFLYKRLRSTNANSYQVLNFNFNDGEDEHIHKILNKQQQSH